jgi:hypothetical protein
MDAKFLYAFAWTLWWWQRFVETYIGVSNTHCVCICHVHLLVLLSVRWRVFNRCGKNAYIFYVAFVGYWKIPREEVMVEYRKLHNSELYNLYWSPCSWAYQGVWDRWDMEHVWGQQETIEWYSYPLHTMKAYRGNGRIAPVILDFGTKWRWWSTLCLGHFSLGKNIIA